MFRAFLVAVQFLTRIPVPLDASHITPETLGRSVAFYPLVGLLMGVSLMSVGYLCGNLDANLSAILVLLTWLALSGGLHLDGLADCADAWAGGGGERESMLKIMRDPHNGTWATLAVSVVLLTKFAALISIGAGMHWLALLWIPAIARATAAGLLSHYAYVRTDGIASPLLTHLWRKGITHALLLTIVSAFLTSGWIAFTILVTTVVTVIIFHGLILRKLHGLTGDCLGAVIELVEVSALLVLAINLSL